MVAYRAHNPASKDPASSNLASVTSLIEVVMLYYVYKITNNLNGKFYIGSHQTMNIDDGYMGSGVYIRNSINAHGVDNFTKEILAFFDSRDEMLLYERQLVDEAFVLNPLTYNLTVGGGGGWYLTNREAATKGRILADAVIMDKYGVSNPRCLPHVKENRDAALKRLWESGYQNWYWLGKT